MSESAAIENKPQVIDPKPFDPPAPASADLTWADVRGAELPYRATASHIAVTEDDGTTRGHMFNLAFVALEGGAPDPARPVTFAYNGGPGSCSVPIDFGGIGPKRVRPNGLEHIPAAAPLEDNPASLIAASDLVFLDALGTGWSRVSAGTDRKKVFGIDADADCFARAIVAWLQENGRWGSPVYLYGESYGTTRNAVLMRLLGERGVKLTGVVMLSAIFDWAPVQPGSAINYLGLVPTFAACAQHFGKAGEGKSADEWFDEAMAFTDDVLAPALLKGDRLSPKREAEVAAQLAQVIGVSAEFIRAKHLRVGLTDFRRELLRDEGKAVGRLDMRFVSDAPSWVQTSSEWLAGEDAADDAVDAAWTTAFRAFCANTLGYAGLTHYKNNIYAEFGKDPWSWSHGMLGTDDDEAITPNVALDIAVAMRRDPTIKLAIIGGRYDAATPWYNAVYDMSAQYLSPELKRRVSWYRYGCGHMAYVDEETNTALGQDMREFYAKQ